MFKWCVIYCGYKNRLFISMIDKKRLFFVVFFFLFKLVIGKIDCLIMLLEWFKYMIGCCSFYVGVNQWWFILLFGSIFLENWIQMKVFIMFIEQQDFGFWCDVVFVNGFGIIGNIVFNIFCEKCKVIFMCLGLGKVFIYRNFLRLY